MIVVGANIAASRRARRQNMSNAMIALINAAAAMDNPRHNAAGL